MQVFSHNNNEIENGSKKTFAIIPKSAKFANVLILNMRYFTLTCKQFVCTHIGLLLACTLLPVDDLREWFLTQLINKRFVMI